MKTTTQTAEILVNIDITDMGRMKTISLGKPVTAPCLVPVLHASTPTCINQPFMVDGEVYRVTALSFGTPHGVVLVDDVAAVDVPKIGSALDTHALFPKGASIVFAQVIDGETIKARLWQNDGGEAVFTHEAACAAVAAAMMLQRLTKYKITVIMGEYTFVSEWDRVGDITLTGEAALML
jgi:diaminopimelate epimerase